MMGIVVLTMFVCLGGLSVPSADAQEKCVPGAALSAEQQARRREGVRIARLVNTAQANQAGAAARKFLRQDELASSAFVQKQIEGQDPFVKSLNFTTGNDVLPGWELKLDVTADGYWFMVKDKTDPCGFG